jgi:hemin uptake protein HemP
LIIYQESLSFVLLDLIQPDMSSFPDLSVRQPAPPGERLCPPTPILAEFLFHGRQEVLITHQGQTYRLRITRNGKLILTK